MAVGLKEMIAKARSGVREIPPAAVKNGVDAGEIGFANVAGWRQG